MNGWVVIVLVAALVACGSSKDEPPARDRQAKTTDAAAKPESVESAKVDGLPVAEHLDCATLVPTEVVEKHFPGATVTQYDKAAARKRLNLPPDPSAARCDVDTEMGPVTIIEFNCGVYLEDELVEQTYAQITKDERITGIGRAGGELPGQISVADDDTACIIVLSYLGQHRDALVALARDIVPLATPASIGAAR